MIQFDECFSNGLKPPSIFVFYVVKVSVVLLVSSEERQKYQGNCESLVSLLTWWQVGGDYDAGKSLFHMEAAPNLTTKGGQLFW